jgi:exodeoxyribonuclease VII large subunit
MLTVSALTKKIKLLLEDKFSEVTVEGEISNFKPHVSGHWYFNLKDSEATICCTMWRGNNNNVFFSPEDGMKIVITGKISVYAPRGNYQLDVRSMKPAGVGELQAAFERLKNKLAGEGLFDPRYKKELPLIPTKIGIVTAIDGAAFRDMISVAKRRFPLVELIIAPARVQGTGAAENIVKSIEELNKRDDIDVIIVGRGGGSIEDLWAFNEEIVARAMFKSKIPLISGVGHEVDFTIADFVADIRAATPTAAMEIATPSKEDFIAFIDSFSYNAMENLISGLSRRKERLNSLIKSYGFRRPQNLIREKSQLLDNLLYRTDKKILDRIKTVKSDINLLTSQVDSHDIKRSLKKGFVLVKQDSKFITRYKNFIASETAELIFYDGIEKLKGSEGKN